MEGNLLLLGIYYEAKKEGKVVLLSLKCHSLEPQ